MALNTITQVKLLNGQVIDLVNWTDQPLYSSVDLRSGFTTQEVSLFQYVEGDQVPGFGPAATTSRTATQNDTNIATPGSMASTEEMLVYAIKPEVYMYYMTDDADFNTRTYTSDPGGDGLLLPPMAHGEGLEILNQQLLLQLIISQKVFAEASFGYFNKGFGVSGFNSGLEGPSAPSNNGLPSQEAVRSFVIPHHIGAQEKYRVTLNNTSAIENGAVLFGTFAVDAEGPTIVSLDNVMATIRISLDGLYKRPTA